MWLDYPNPGIPSYQGKCLRIRGITLCGSTRFKEQFLEAQKRLTLAGNIVISVGLFGHSGESTRSEIAYAIKNGKRVEYLEPLKNQ